MRRWSDLSPDEQLSLREIYGNDPDDQGTTCDLSVKVTRFAGWLAERGIDFTPDDLPGRPRS